MNETRLTMPSTQDLEKHVQMLQDELAYCKAVLTVARRQEKARAGRPLQSYWEQKAAEKGEPDPEDQKANPSPEDHVKLAMEKNFSDMTTGEYQAWRQKKAQEAIDAAAKAIGEHQEEGKHQAASQGRPGVPVSAGLIRS